MNSFLVDLHIHTQLSPCGSLDMTPMAIVEEALKHKLDAIAITDHNSTRQAELVIQIGIEKGLTVFPGAEITTIEEVHCLAIFENIAPISQFQKFIDENLISISNKPDKFGYQVLINKNEEIIYEEDKLLIASMNKTIKEVEEKVHELGGLFIPAHVDRYHNGLFGQLGMLPAELNFDALGLSVNAKIDKWRSDERIPRNTTFIMNSDAHSPEQIGLAYTEFELESLCFKEIKLALKQKSNRNVKCVSKQM